MAMAVVDAATACFGQTPAISAILQSEAAAQAAADTECLRAIEAAGNPKPLPHELPGNRPFFEAAKGLVHCLLETGRRGMAADVCRRIAPLDPVDPLGIQKLLVRPGGDGKQPGG